MNPYIHEKLLEQHRQDVQREIEHYRLVASLQRNHSSIVRYTLSMLGVLLIKLGTRLKKVGQQPVPQC